MDCDLEYEETLPNNVSLSYREVVPDCSTQEEWEEITLNTGATLSTLQDIKISEKSGGYCFKNVELIHNRNRFIYWRTYRDILELTEISLDFNLYHNKLRYKFAGSPVISVTITEEDRFVCLLVSTVCSLHRINFPHPDTLADGSCSSSRSGSGFSNDSSAATPIDFHESQSFSIFRDASAIAARDPNSFYVFDTQSIIKSTTLDSVPNCAVSYLSPSGDVAYFALSWQSELMIYCMNSLTGMTIGQPVKSTHKFPRLFENLKGVFSAKHDTPDEDTVTSMVFTCFQLEIYLLTMYRNNHLRIWSASTMQCVGSVSFSGAKQFQRSLSAQSNLLRKINESRICVYLSYAEEPEFVCMYLAKEAPNTLSFYRYKVISAPTFRDLHDFDVSESRIWALWSNADGDFSISNFSFIPTMPKNWVSAAMEPTPDRSCIGNESGIDPRESYCTYIFHPGKFDRSIITKALLMYRRSSLRIDHKHYTMSMLKEQVCQAVEEEIQNETKDFEMSEEEHLEVSNRLWERFYSCCEQYHSKATEPLGLVILEPIDAICIIKKNTFSLLRPCESLEHIMLSGETVNVGLVVRKHFEENKQFGEDIVNLMSIIAYVEKCLSEDCKLDLDKKLYYLENPETLIAKLVNQLLADVDGDDSFPKIALSTLRDKLNNVENWSRAIGFLLECICMDTYAGEIDTHIRNAQTSRVFLSIGALFGSNIGISFLSETVRQVVAIRFAICRNLLILLQLIGEVFKVVLAKIPDALMKDYLSKTTKCLQCYYLLVWIAETPVNMSSLAALEPSIERLNMLQLTNGSGRIYGCNGKYLLAPLLRVFLNAKGLYTSLSLFCNSFNNSDQLSWQKTLLPLSSFVCQLLWPCSTNFIFGEWLFGTCQHILIADYVRLLNSWCSFNKCSRQFILGVSLLDCGETHKAHDLFIESSAGISTESFLYERLLNSTSEERKEHDVISSETGSTTVNSKIMRNFYMKIVQLFECYNAYDLIILTADEAINLLGKQHPDVPMFQTIIFNNHLHLEHYQEAYDSLVTNADKERRKDCLRQLVMTLFNRKRFDLLIKFPYVGLYEELETIVATRARSLVIEDNDIYDFLFAFHVNHNNHRKAAAVMYEQAMRCQMESNTKEILKKRCAALLACINALHLADSRYRWIAKPILNDENIGNNNYADQNNEPKIAVLEIKDIKREWLQADALLRLSEFKDIRSCLKTGPQELSMILAGFGLYIDAIRLAKGFDLPLCPIIDNLTAACVLITEEPNQDDAWSWLQENNFADLPHREDPVDFAWFLLQKIIRENEQFNSTQIRKGVVNKMLSLNQFVPQWLYNEYKAANCSELLRLYVNHNRLLEAKDLAMEMLSAMQGAGSEYFSFKHSIGVTNKDMCLPVATLDILLYNLRANGEDELEYKLAASELTEAVDKYLKTARRVANDKLQMAYLAKLDQQREPMYA